MLDIFLVLLREIRVLKILLANKFFYLKGGVEASFFEIAEVLKQRGHEIAFFCMKHPRNYSSEYENYFVSNVDYENHTFKNIINASMKLLYSFEAKKNIERLISEERPDIVHLNSIYHQISPSIIHSLRKFGISSVMTLHDYKLACVSYLMMNNGNICEACKNGRYYHCFLQSCVKNSKIKSLLNTIEMYLHHKIMHIYELVDIFISPSKFLKVKLEKMGFKGKIVYLPNFVKAENFKPEFNWKENSIIYFGRLSKEKGLFTLIEAMKNVKDLSLKIIGEGPIEESLKSKINCEKIKNVNLLGFKTGKELKDEIKKSMFVVLPSEWYENNPISVIESFALGKPVVGARVGGIPELIKNYETGLTFELGQSEDLILKINYLKKNSDIITGMGKKARAFVEQELSSEKYYQRLMEIYNYAISKH